MSYHYRGRYTHDHNEYQRWKRQDQAQSLQRRNQALRDESSRLSSQLDNTRESLRSSQRDVRQAARRHASLEARQGQLETFSQRIQQQHTAFQRQTEERQRELEQEIHESERRTAGSIAAAEQRVTGQVNQLRQETAEHLASVREEVAELREDLEHEVAEVRSEVRETREHLEQEIDVVRGDLEAERQQRITKEQTRSAQASATADWVEANLERIRDVNAPGLDVESIRIQEQLSRVRETLASDPEMAAPLAQTAFASFQTLYLESERRNGFMEGTASYVEELAVQLEALAQDSLFQQIFPAEAQQVGQVVAEMRARAEAWLAKRHWHTFENERERVLEIANSLLGLALELKALVPHVVQQLTDRDKLLREMATAITTASGTVDKFERSYANENDPKSPRLLRAVIGPARVDTYVELDGHYRIDAYGFDTSGDCSRQAERLAQQLERHRQLEMQVDPANPQQPSIPAESEDESWRSLTAEVEQVAKKVDSGR